MEKAEEGVKLKYLETSAKIELKLVTTSEIKGDLEWQRTPSEGKWSVNSEKSKISGSMGIEVFGSVHAEAKTFMVRAAAGASIAMKSADGKEQSKFTLFWAALEGAENPSLERQMSFNGLGIYYSYFAELGTDGTQAGKAVQAAVQQVRARSSDKATVINEQNSENLMKAGDKDEMKELCVLMKEWNGKNESIQMGNDSI